MLTEITKTSGYLQINLFVTENVLLKGIRIARKNKKEIGLNRA
jgi:hypothetical protein